MRQRASRRNLVIASLLGLVVGNVSRSDAANPPPPLPLSEVQAPAMLFVIDRSGSMDACDGGDNPGYNNCDADGSGPAPANSGSTRMRAAQLAMLRILDANGDGSVDEGDEQTLKLKVGLAAYSASSDGASSATLTAVWPVGSPYRKVFCGTDGGGNPKCEKNLNGNSAIEGIDDLDPTEYTPTAEALQQSYDAALKGCYDGSAATVCNLANPITGNDPATGCRLKAIVLLTDGLSNGANDDPAQVAANLKALSSPAGGIRTYVIGTGTGFDPNEVNCIARFGGTDANLDGDATSTTTGGASSNCSGNRSNYSAGGLGNAFRATKPQELAAAISKIINDLNPGFFTRSRPGLNRGGTALYTSYFEVRSGVIGWQGHLKKYRIGVDGTYQGVLDCGSGLQPSGNPEACWDAGGELSDTGDADPFTTSEERIMTRGQGLEDRAWTSRKVYTVIPKDETKLENDDFEDLFEHEGEILGAGVYGKNNGSDANAMAGPNPPSPSGAYGQYMIDLVPVVSDLMTNGLPTDIDVDDLSGNQQIFVMMAYNMRRQSKLRYANLQVNDLAEAFEEIKFSVGVPTSTFGDGQKRCNVQAGCNDTKSAWKLGDVFDSKPVVVTAPILGIDDPDFPAFVNSTGGNPPVRFCKDGSASCPLKGRGTVVYVASNDGAIHAFREDTGAELWAFIPWEAQYRLPEKRFRRSVVLNHELFIRETKFPSVTSDGADRSDKKWHTVLYGAVRDGGEYMFAIDISDPVTPRFLWEYRKPQKMGLTYSLGQIGRLPAKGGEYRQRFFYPGGVFPETLSGGTTPPADLVSCIAGCSSNDPDPDVAADEIEECQEDCLKDCLDDCADVRQAAETTCKNTRKTCEQGCGGNGACRQACGEAEKICRDMANAVEDTCSDECRGVVDGAKGHVHFFSFWPHDAKNGSKDHHAPGHPGLETSSTLPPGLRADMTGSLSIADAEPDGTTERGYYGDFEGRVWKLCDIKNNGDFKLHLFFDPAFYMFKPPVPPGYETKNPAYTGAMLNRGPIFYPLDVTPGDPGYLNVVVGTGDVNNLLRDPFATAGYRNRVWILKDRVDGNLDAGLSQTGLNNAYVKHNNNCAPAQEVTCSAAGLVKPQASVPTVLDYPQSPGHIEIDQILTGPAIVFNSNVLYTEYDPNPDGDVCTIDGFSRLRGRTTVCGPTGGVGPFNGSDTVTFDPSQGVVSGPIVDPTSGQVFVTSSVVDPNDPSAGIIQSTLGIGINAGTRSWRQRN